MIVREHELEKVKNLFISLDRLGITIPIKCRLLFDQANMLNPKYYKYEIVPKENI